MHSKGPLRDTTTTSADPFDPKLFDQHEITKRTHPRSGAQHMKTIRFFIGILTLVAATHTAFADSSWITTTGGTFDWNSSGNWTGTFPPARTDTVRVTNSLASSQLITNMGGSSATATTNTINQIIVSNSLGGASVTVQQAAGVVMVLSNGFQIGQNATLILVTNTSFGGFGTTPAGGQLNFNLRAGGQPGTLILSNASATAGFSTFANSEGGITNSIANQGTIQFNPNGNQLVSINYAQTALFTNDVLGTIVMNGTGTGAFVGNFGSRNITFLNNGTIFASAGTFRVDSRDAFSRGGFQNMSNGFIEVDAPGIFELRRTTNAWVNGPTVTNVGTIFMNGGTALLFDLDQGGNAIGTNTARILANGTNSTTGYIYGKGLLNLTIRNAGSIEARGGTLSFVASTGNAGTWVSTNYGGGSSVLNFTTGNFDLGGGSIVNTNGGLRVINGANMTLSTSYRQNFGTLDFAGAASVFVANSPSAGALTNEFVIKKSGSGQATLTTGFGQGQNNYAFINNGTLNVSGGAGGTLTINAGDTFFSSFSNTVTGTTFIDSANALRISRTANAWVNGTATPFSSGTISLNGGALELADTNSVNPARYLMNAGTLNGNGTISGSISNLPGAFVSPGFGVGTNTINGSVAFGSNSTLSIDLGALAGQNDLLNVGNTLTLDANSVLNISGGAVGNVYTVATYSAVSGSFGSTTPFYSVTYNAGNLTIAPLPGTNTITASAGANGGISPSGSVSVTNGNNQSFTITPNACYNVATVLVDSVNVGAASSYTFTNVTANHTINASFSLISYTINASAGPNGSISPNGAVSVNCGANQAFTITPNTGYHIADVQVDSVSVGAVNSYTSMNVTAGHTIAATFAINTYTINASAGANGSIAPSGAVSVNYGNNQSFTITPNAGYHIADVQVDSVSVGAVSSYTFTNVTAAHTIASSFAINTYIITASADPNGSINPSGAVTVTNGNNQSFTITANTGYHIADVQVDSVSVGVVSGYTFTNVTAAHTINASIAVTGPTNSWIDGTGKWETGADWSKAVAPSLADAADLITNAGNNTVTIDAITTNSPGTMTISNLTVSAPAGSSNTLQAINVEATPPLHVLNTMTISTGGALLLQTNSVVAIDNVGTATNLFNEYTAALVVGNLGQGTLTINGGTVTLLDPVSDLSIGDNINSTGAVWLTGGTLVTTNNFGTVVGNAGTGYMTVSNGTWLAGPVYVPLGGNGTLTIAGGTNIFTSTTFFIGGNNINATGTVWMTGGQLSVPNLGADIADGSVGSMTLSNGTWTDGVQTTVGANGGVGTLTIAGGILSTPQLDIGDSGGTGTVWMTGGQMVLTNSSDGAIFVGFLGGRGLMVVSNGTVLAQEIDIGTNTSSSGELDVVGGTVTVLSAGSASVLLGTDVGSTGTVTVTSGGALTITNGTFGVAVNGVGSVTATNGALNLNEAEVASGPNSVGTVTLLADTTTTIQSNLIVGAGAGATGIVNFMGGTHVIGGTLSAGSDGACGGSGFGQMNIANASVTAANIQLGSSLGGHGIMNVRNGGIIHIPQNVIAGGLTINEGILNGGVIDAPGATMWAGKCHPGEFIASNGVASVMQFHVGLDSQGTYTHVGGTVNVFSNLVVGSGAGVTGIVNMTGGSLFVTNSTGNPGIIAVGNTGDPAQGTGFGQMSIQNASVTANRINLGSSAGGHGVMTVGTGGTVHIPPGFGGCGACGLNYNDGILDGGVIDAPGAPFWAGQGHPGAFIVSNGVASFLSGYVGFDNTGTMSMYNGTVNIYSNLVVGDCGASVTGSVLLAGGTLYVTNATHNAVLDVRDGTFTVNGGVLVVDTLVVTNPCGHLVLVSGTISATTTNLDPTLSAVGDGIPNSWKQQYGFGPFDPTVASADPDGDGFSNLQEYQAGTNPLDPNSKPLRITAVARQGNDFTVTWLTLGGTTNMLQVTGGTGNGSFSTNGFADIGGSMTIVPGVGPVTTNYTETGGATNTPARYYRIRLVP